MGLVEERYFREEDWTISDWMEDESIDEENSRRFALEKGRHNGQKLEVFLNHAVACEKELKKKFRGHDKEDYYRYTWLWVNTEVPYVVGWYHKRPNDIHKLSLDYRYLLVQHWITGEGFGNRINQWINENEEVVFVDETDKPIKFSENPLLLPDDLRMTVSPLYLKPGSRYVKIMIPDIKRLFKNDSHVQTWLGKDFLEKIIKRQTN
jgi:hypothetical protein